VIPYDKVELPPSVRNRQRHRKIKKRTIVKGQKNKILTRRESRSASIAFRTDRHSSRHYVFYFLPRVYPDERGTHFLKTILLPTHIAHIAKAPRANAPTKALSKSAILPMPKYIH